MFKTKKTRPDIENGARTFCGHALPDGMTVRIDDVTAYEPDALVYCGTKLPPSAVEVPNPVIVVEVLSPSTRHIDLSAKLADYFRGYGADSETATRMAAAVSRNPDIALRVHTREELGVDPQDLPSAVLAGVASLLAFSLGALVPLLPWLAGLESLAASLGITAVALAAGGMVVGWLTGRPLLRSGLRQLALGGLAVGVTFGVGTLIGSYVG